MQRDDDDTPPRRFQRVLVTPAPSLATPSKHPRVLAAREWRGTIVSVVGMLMVGMLAAMQSWPPEVALPALGFAAAPGTLEALRAKR